MNHSTKQISLKPQDLLVLFKIACYRDNDFTYKQLAFDLGISISEAHACLRRAGLARLVFKSEEGAVLQHSALQDFVLYGARYSFPASLGTQTQGMPTGYAAAPLRQLIVQPEELPPVWPQPRGALRGIAICPLYHTVPAAAARDPALYEYLSLFDALRAGAARERELAQQALSERL